MKIKTAYIWEQGEKAKNEDSLVLEHVETKAGPVLLAAVCDGIGGLSEGEVASGFMAEMLVVWFYKEFLVLLQKKKSRRKLQKSAIRILYEAHELLKSYAKQKHIRLGTTVTMLLVTKNYYFIVHVGDSRLYKMQRKLKIMTRQDGTGNILHRCIGAGKYEKPQWKCARWKRDTAFLVCTDGVYKTLNDEEIKIVLKKNCKTDMELQKRLKETVRIMKSRTMKDNASAICVVVQK